MYTESFGNARKFARIARRVSRTRPIVAVRTGAAAIGPSGGALYQQAGLIEVPTVAGMLDTARVLATQPPMRGSRVAVLANARSPQTLSEAALHTAGLETVPCPRRLDWRSTPDDYGEALRAALTDDTIDAVMIVHAPPMADQVDAPVEAIEAAARGATKPIVTVLMGGRNGPLRPGSSLPAFAFPEPAAGVLGRVHLYGAWLADEADAAISDVGDIDRAGARGVITAALERGDRMLDVGDVVSVLRAYGITAPETHKAPAADAAAIAEAIGYPVAVKAERRHLGRSLMAGVALDLAHEAEVLEAVVAMQEALGDDAANVVVQPMVSPGLDLRIRSTVDDKLGPLIATGLGGSGADLLSDEAARLAPLSTAGAIAMVAGSRAGPALHEAGLPATTVVDTLIRVAQLVGDHPEIESADLNPIVVSADSAAVTDAIIHVRRPRQDRGPIRRLD
jgi:acyl-CoA synthetase (NDP forming)